MLDILEWTLDVIGVTYRRLDGRYCSISIHSTECFAYCKQMCSNIYNIYDPLFIHVHIDCFPCVMNLTSDVILSLLEQEILTIRVF